MNPGNNFVLNSSCDYGFMKIKFDNEEHEAILSSKKCNVMIFNGKNQETVVLDKY